MIKFQGTRKELGRWYGQRLQEYHHDGYRTVPNPETLRRQLKIYEKFYPELLTEKLAAAEVMGQDPRFLLYEDLAAFVDSQKRRVNPHQHGCTIFALRENGKTFVGRNYDWLPEAREFFERYDWAIAGVNRYFAFSDEAVWGRHLGKRSRKPYCEDAVNEHGLYLGLTYSYIDSWDYGLTPSHLIRYIAEHCETTRQALNVFKKIPCAIPKNFLIADAKGDLPVVEHVARSFEVVRPDENGILIQTNHCLVPKLQKLDTVRRKRPRTTSFVRYAETDCLLHQQLPDFQFTDLWRILRQSQYVYNSDTIWSLALELSEPRFNIYYDTAMGQKHTKFSFK